MGKLFIFLGGLLVSLLVYLAYLDLTAERFSLRKDSWDCTATHIETTFMPQADGNVQPVFNTVCDNWRRKGSAS